MSYRVTLSLPDIEGDNPVMAVEAFAHAAREWEQWQYVVVDDETGLRYDVDMQTADEGGVIYPTLVEGGVRNERWEDLRPPTTGDYEATGVEPGRCGHCGRRRSPVRYSVDMENVVCKECHTHVVATEG